jgi:hypothetical protein
MARAGHTTCPLCGTAEIAVTRTGAGTLNLKCHRCEFSAYGKPGSRAARLIAEKMTADEDATEATPTAQPKTDAPAPPKTPKTPPPRTASAFAIGNL